MHIQKIQFDDVRYNPAISAFEASVRIREDGVEITYPVHVCAPLTAEFVIIARRLAEKARKRHNDKADGLHMRRQLGDIGAYPLYVKAA